MASQALEQKLGIVPTTGQEDRAYQTLDVYTSSLSQMYTGPMKLLNPIGSMGSGFKSGGPGNIRRDIGYGLQERYDFSGHNGSGPQINYDILGTNIKLGSSYKIDLDIFNR